MAAISRPNIEATLPLDLVPGGQDLEIGDLAGTLCNCQVRLLVQ